MESGRTDHSVGPGVYKRKVKRRNEEPLANPMHTSAMMKEILMTCNWQY
jgi:hypothetical protein